MTTLSSLQLYLGFWSVVAANASPPANRTVSISVTTTVHRGDVADLTALTVATLWRIDGDHANPLDAWHMMGAPAAPNSTQLAALIASSVVHPKQVPVAVRELGSSPGSGDNVDVVVTLQVPMSPNSAVMVSL